MATEVSTDHTKERSTCWSITINNPTDKDREEMNIANQKGWKMEGQVEAGGANGVVHYQMMLRTPQLRWSAIKKVFSRAHIEVTRNVAALQQYVHKEDTRVGDLPTQSEKYPSLSKYWALVYQYCVDNLLLDMEFPNHPRWFTTKKHVDPLQVLDEATEYLICEGYHVETIAVNPQTRSCFAKFSLALFKRALIDKRQTDRQKELEALEAEKLNVVE